ncbi:hypothetical protein AHF37_06680 [Paragonimus kellicotti]|nr:hypothetical protein AHF37_06680 [Paragonimus kellicotti]
MPTSIREASMKACPVNNQFKALKKTLRTNAAHPTDWLLSKKMVLHPRVCLWNKLAAFVDLGKVTSPNPIIHGFQSARSAQSSSLKDCRHTTRTSNGRMSYSSTSCFPQDNESARRESILRRPSSAPITICSESAKQSETQLSASTESQSTASLDPSCLLMGEKNEVGSTPNSQPCSREPLEKNVIQLEAGYNRAWKHHGWKMEIPGDPLNIKRKYLPKRLSYTVAFELGQTLPLPPRMQYQNRGTFFQPTFPAQPLSFTLSPEFPSEIYVARMNAFRKTSGHWPYGERQYAFAY